MKAIALDKTGTITEGKPKMVATELLATDVAEAQIAALGCAVGEPVRPSRVEGDRPGLAESQGASRDSRHCRVGVCEGTVEGRN